MTHGSFAMPSPVRALRVPIIAIVLAAGSSGAVPLAAQDMIAREVVQPLPTTEVQRLNRALVALAKSPRDLDALVEAGTAAMEVNDLDAAVGFFGRAAELDPADPQVARGLGTVYLRSGRAGEALQQFDRALASGGAPVDVLADQSLAFDLVGDSGSAQRGYARVLELDPANDEARRRLAVSHAISGNRARFEEALRPLLERRDMAAFRARAFGLAILGDQDRAAAIVEQVMPRDLSTRIVPYLAYMPRLTGPQQAAAANLGIFPRAADIGRDDPRLARFAAEARADSRLQPAGEPLGPRVASSPAVAAAPALPNPQPAAVQTVSAAAAVPTPASVPVPLPAPFPDPFAAPAAAQAPAPAATPSPAPMPVAVPAPVPAPAPAHVPALAASPDPVRVADAFADLTAGALPDPKVGAGAVDLARIAIPREAPPPPPVAKPAAAKPAKKEPPRPVHPSRVWVQLATGRDASAFAFDWRRLSRSGGDVLARLKPHTTPWGQAHRLLVGPLDNRDKGQALVRELKAKGLDSFLYVSPTGEEIQPVK